MEIPLRRNRAEFQRPPQGEFRARAARKSDDTTEKVQPAGGGGSKDEQSLAHDRLPHISVEPQPVAEGADARRKTPRVHHAARQCGGMIGTNRVAKADVDADAARQAWPLRND